MKVNEIGELENVVGSPLKWGIVPDGIDKIEDILDYLHKKVFEDCLADFVSVNVYFIFMDNKVLKELSKNSKKEDLDTAKLQLAINSFLIPDMVRICGNFQLCRFDNFDV